MRNGDRGEFTNAMTGAINAAKKQVALESAGKALGGIIGFGFATFAVPLIALYAWGGMTPEDWADLAYLPTVAGFFVFRILIHWMRTE